MRAMARKKPKKNDNVIARNKRAGFDYHLLETFEAGVALSGWEVKSLRMGKADLGDSYVLMKDGEAFLLAPASCCCTRRNWRGSWPARSRKA